MPRTAGPYRRRAQADARAGGGAAAVSPRRSLIRRVRHADLRGPVPRRDRRAPPRRSRASRRLGQTGAQGAGANRSRRQPLPSGRRRGQVGRRAPRFGAGRDGRAPDRPGHRAARIREATYGPAPIRTGCSRRCGSCRRRFSGPLRWFWTQPKFYDALGSQIESIPISAAETLDAAAGGYGDLPLITISSTNPERSPAASAGGARQALDARPTPDRHQQRPLDPARPAGARHRHDPRPACNRSRDGRVDSSRQAGCAASSSSSTDSPAPRD